MQDVEKIHLVKIIATQFTIFDQFLRPNIKFSLQQLITAVSKNYYSCFLIN